MRKLKHRVIAFFVGIALAPAIVLAGLESGVYISDLVATNPLGSDLASTIDDHIRLLKSTIKATFPNINGAVSATDEELSLLAGKTGTVWTSSNDGSGSTLDADLLDGVSSAGFCQTGGSGCPGGVTGAANPSSTIGLSATNGSATTFMRSDAAPALSQGIAPTWTAPHVFANSGIQSGTSASVVMRSLRPYLLMNQSDASANNALWGFTLDAEQFRGEIVNDAVSAGANWLTVDRTGTTVDRVAFPTQASGGFSVGSLPGVLNSSRMVVATTTSNVGALQLENTGTSSVLFINNAASSGDNPFIRFATESSGLGTERGSITYNRAGGVTAYNTTSDARLKKNFKPAPTARKLIDCIPVESYDWKDSGNHVAHGLVAQRLHKCAPYAVTQGDIWQIDPSKLVPALIKYVQEQDARIARLEADAARRH